MRDLRPHYTMQLELNAEIINIMKRLLLSSSKLLLAQMCCFILFLNFSVLISVLVICITKILRVSKKRNKVIKPPEDTYEKVDDSGRDVGVWCFVLFFSLALAKD